MISSPNAALRFDEIYDSTNKAVLTYITAKCRQIADVGDIFQETYMELYRVLDKRGADYISNEKAFVMRLARQKISRHYSLMERLRIFVSMTLTDDDGDEVDLADFEAEGFLTEDLVVSNVMYENALRAIKSKPEDVQKIFYLMYEVGLTIAEIAQALGIKESNVKNKLYRTLKELRDLLK